VNFFFDALHLIWFSGQKRLNRKSRREGRKGGKGSDPAPNPPISGNATYNQTYYKVEDADGNEIITKEVSDRRGTQPCFTKFQEGKCDREDCLYSHDFNLESRPERARGVTDIHGYS
jgi:hypothetical protein